MSSSLSPNLYLVGMPASGKTTIGKKLSRLLKRPFLDTDWQIEKITGLSVAEYFEKYGEKSFRELEREVLLRTFDLSGYVIATGGGLAAYSDNMDLIVQGGIAVYVDTPLSVLVSRINSQPNKRPLFSGNNLQESLWEKLQERQKYYRRAHWVISPFDDLCAFAQKVTSWLPDAR